MPEKKDQSKQTPEEVREEAVEVYLGEKPAEEASDAAREELAHPTEVRESRPGAVSDAAAEFERKHGVPAPRAGDGTNMTNPFPSPGVRPGVTLPETEGRPETDPDPSPSEIERAGDGAARAEDERERQPTRRQQATRQAADEKPKK